MIKLFLSRQILNLNRFLSVRVSKKKYFFFVKYIYSFFLLARVDLSLNFSFDKKKKTILC